MGRESKRKKEEQYRKCRIWRVRRIKRKTWSKVGNKNRAVMRVNGNENESE